MSTAVKKTTIHKYSSGRVAVCINDTDGGAYSYFYSDSDPSDLLSSFDCRGVGFVNHSVSPNPPRFVSGKGGGTISKDNGDVVERFDWLPKRPSASSGVSKPTRMILNPQLVFMLTDKHSMTMTFRGSRGFIEFELGAPNTAKSGTYLDKSTRSLTGRLSVKLSNHVTLKDQQTLLADNPAAANMRKAQEYGWPLPRASASAAKLVPIGDETLRGDVAGQSFRIGELLDFRTSIGRNTRSLKAALQATSRDPSSGGNFGTTKSNRALSVASSKYRRAVAPPPLPEVVGNGELASYVEGARSGQVREAGFGK